MSSLRRSVHRTWRFCKRMVRCAKTLATDPRLPKWLRVFLACMFLPIPGPFDEVVGVVGFGILFVFYRTVLTEAWTGAQS